MRYTYLVTAERRRTSGSSRLLAAYPQPVVPNENSIMRLWSIHPKYLDKIGLIALWRESLLAQAVLNGKTKGYKNHPQLLRFKNSDTPIISISAYLYYIYYESKERKYSFNNSKILKPYESIKIPCTSKQLEYEFLHLKNKLINRNIEAFKSIHLINIPEPNPIFKIIEGEIENWEVIKNIKPIMSLHLTGDASAGELKRYG